MGKGLRVRACVVAIALVAISVAAVGCGSGGSEATAHSSETKVSVPSRSEFVARADKVCEKAEPRQEALLGKFAKQHRPPSAKAELALVKFAGLPPLREEAAELKQLPLPTEGKADMERFIASFEKALASATQDPNLMLELEKSPFEASEAVAERVGLTACGGA
jgi:hypothetical protein